MQREEILALNVTSLKEQLSVLNLATSGRKRTLQDRLLDHYNLSAEVIEDEESDYGDATSMHDSSSTPGEGRSAFTLRDIEDSLSQFNGSSQPSVHSWIQEFEDNAAAVQWNSTGRQNVTWVDQLLKGAAKIFVRSQPGISSWSSHKRALEAEFGSDVSVIEVHRMLKNRRKGPNENYKEYSLMEIGKPVNLDDASLIEYFIEGIPDSRGNKSNLYQARTLQELKDQKKGV
ncbi:hypothetical protein KR084_002578 [Drosophila pseudotakahashii]|nr:hypothetical protein KR084_002578 [Drosophila pseudotakahashii]